MDAVETTYAVPPGRPRQRGAEERIRQLIARHKAEAAALKMQAEYLQRVAAMLIPLTPKQIVARILRDAKEGVKNVGSR